MEAASALSGDLLIEHAALSLRLQRNYHGQAATAVIDSEKKSLRTMPREGAQQRKGWSMQPSLHDRVSSLLEPENLISDFHNVDEDHTSVREKLATSWASLSATPTHVHLPLGQQDDCDHHPHVSPQPVQCEDISPTLPQLQQTWSTNPRRNIRRKSGISCVEMERVGSGDTLLL